MVIRGIFTNTKLSPTRMNSETTVPYIVGDECGEDLATSFIYRECAEKWDIYHIHVEHGGYYSVERVSDSWKPYVGDNLIISDKEHVGESIARIVSNSYGQQTNS